MAAVSKSAWGRAGTHTITLPSGAEVDIRIPDLARMAAQGKLDNELLKDAVPPPDPNQEYVADEPEPAKTPEERKKALADLAEFNAWLVSITVVDPKITPEEAADPKIVPTEDLEVIVEFATRRRDMDVLGHHMAGLETNADWRTFRGLPSRDEDLLDE